MTDTQNQNQQRGIDRRTFLRTTGVSAGALAVGGTGAINAGTQDADALLPVAGAALLKGAAVVATAFSAGAGAIAARDLFSGTDLDPSANVDDVVFAIVDAIRGQRVREEQRMIEEYLERPLESNPFAESAFMSAEAEAARTLAEGGTQAEATANALSALDRHYAKAIYNGLQSWNEVWLGGEDSDGLLSGLVMRGSIRDVGDTMGHFRLAVGDDNDLRFKLLEPGDVSSNVEPVELSEVWADWPPDDGDDDLFGEFEMPDTGAYMLYEMEYELPVDPDNIDDIEDNPKVVMPVTQDSGSQNIDYDVVGPPVPDAPWTTLELDNADTDAAIQYTREDITVVSVAEMEFFEIIKDTYELLRDEAMEPHVDRIADDIEEGDADPEDFISPEQLLRNWDDADGRGIVAAAAIASGLPPVGDFSQEVEIDHPDLPEGTTWGDLYIDFDDIEDELDLEPGDTIDPEDFSSAYFGYETEDGDYENMLLDSSEPITIQDTSDGEPLTYRTPTGYVDPDAELSEGAILDRLTQTAETSRQMEDDGLSLGGIGGGFGDSLSSIFGSVQNAVLAIAGFILLIALIGNSGS